MWSLCEYIKTKLRWMDIYVRVCVCVCMSVRACMIWIVAGFCIVLHVPSQHCIMYNKILRSVLVVYILSPEYRMWHQSWRQPSNKKETISESKLTSMFILYPNINYSNMVMIFFSFRGKMRSLIVVVMHVCSYQKLLKKKLLTSYNTIWFCCTVIIPVIAKLIAGSVKKKL